MEIMVVLVVISILVGLLFPALMAARERARRTRAEAEIRELQKAWQVYFTTYESFPSDGPMTKSLTEVLAGNNDNNIMFMEFPEKALGNNGDKNGFRDPWGRHYEVEFNVKASYPKKSAFQSRVQCLNAQRYKY
jgi:type II secretory pathway pseudopilin PulG